MTDVLIIQHEDDTPPGTALLWLQSKALSYSVWRPDQNSTESSSTPQVEDFQALIICGGSMDVFQEDQFPWLKTEKKFIQKFIQSQKPIFGICLGSQLLAELLGGKVYPLHKWEVGFVPVTLLTEPGQPTLHVFHWHQCGFDLPPGATLTATNAFWPAQAFSFGPHIQATQFHPESTIEWIQEGADEVSDRHQGLVQRKKEMLESISLQKPLQEWFFSQLNQWQNYFAKNK